MGCDWPWPRQSLDWSESWLLYLSELAFYFFGLLFLFFLFLFFLFGFLFCLFIWSHCLIGFLPFPFHISFKFFFFHFTHIPKTYYTWSFTLYFLFKLYISNHIIVIPNSAQHSSLVLIHFIILLSFMTITVNFIFSHYAKFLSHTLTLSHHLTSHKCSVFWIQLTIRLPSNKSLICLLPFIKSG